MGRSGEMPARPDITDYLDRWTNGDPDALRDVMPLVYDELKQLCRARLSRSGNVTLQPTEVVHEVFIKLSALKAKTFPNRRAFFGYAATVVHSVLASEARKRSADKRGGGAHHVTLTAVADFDGPPSTELEDLDRVLQALLSTESEKDTRLARVILLKIYTDLTDDAMAQLLTVARPTVQRDWRLGKRLLARELGT